MTLRPSLALVFAGVAAGALGCSSAYPPSDRNTQGLDSQQRETEEERAAHAEAHKYAAVAYFDAGSAELRPASQSELDWFVKMMEPYPNAILEVHGFADGTEATSQELSKDRAETVERYLESKGIEGARIVTKSLSAEPPAALNQSSDGRRNNRCVEVTVR